MSRIWSDCERDYVSANAPILSDASIAAALARLLGRPVTKLAVRRVRQRLGVKKACGRPKPEGFRILGSSHQNFRS